MLKQKYPFILPPLPYAYNALEPYIDEKTVHVHHDKHFAAYVENLNKVLSKYPKLQKLTLRELLLKPLTIPHDDRLAVMRNAGGVYNHDLYFKNMLKDNLLPYKAQTDSQFGGIAGLKTKFNESAMSVFGSGWTYLIKTPAGKLQIVNTRNQETPLALGTPILICDVWEHAYYLKYMNLRKSYIEGWWKLQNYLGELTG